MKRREQKKSFSPFFKKKLFRVGVSHLSTAPKDNPVSWFCRLDNRRISQREHFLLVLLATLQTFPTLEDSILYCLFAILALPLWTFRENFAPAHVGKESGYSKECCFNEIVPPPFPHFQFFWFEIYFRHSKPPSKRRTKIHCGFICAQYFFPEYSAAMSAPLLFKSRDLFFFSQLLHVFYRIPSHEDATWKRVTAPTFPSRNSLIG